MQKLCLSLYPAIHSKMLGEKEVDPIVGRLICWITFSAGAEYLAKGVCLLRGVDIRKLKNDGTTDFGTLKNLHQTWLKKLCAAIHASETDRDRVTACYEHLASIRNRDAHGYVPNIRDSHFDDVRNRFVPCFNLLMMWLPMGRQQVDLLITDSSRFIASVR